MNLNKFMEQGIYGLLKTASKYYLKDAKGMTFIAKAVPEMKKSAQRRIQNEADGLHVPPFLIASITSSCNLHCAGCYSRAAGACTEAATAEMTTAQWQKVFDEASELGVSFILLAGGEPLMRRDVIRLAAEYKNIIFPIFTNGTLVDGEYAALFEQHRNLIPVFSIEGGSSMTDRRRGQGTYDTVRQAMHTLGGKGILYGASITVTKENMGSVTDVEFVRDIRHDGCGLLFYIEYVPVQPGTERLMLDGEDIAGMWKSVEQLRGQMSDMIFVSFPGDEQAMGGCLASGRGFFHINANGGAEPCPFSPQSELNLKNSSIRDALQSKLFEQTRHIATSAEHHGGCTLFEHRDEIENIMASMQ